MSSRQKRVESGHARSVVLSVTQRCDPPPVCRPHAKLPQLDEQMGRYQEDAQLMANQSHLKGHGVTEMTSGHGTKGMLDGWQ